MRLNSDGTLDITFNAGGAGAPGALALVIQPDGKILISGGTVYNGAHSAPDRVQRLNSDGTLDSTFNAGGAGANGHVYAIATQPDGKVIIVGSFSTYNGADTPDFVLRLNSDGTLDSTFNAGGVGANGIVYAVVAQPDGKVLVGGNLTAYSGASVRNRVMRLNSDGTRDTTFNVGGARNDLDVYAIAIQPDGKVIIGGNFN